jgi:hypothetical protein
METYLPVIAVGVSIRFFPSFLAFDSPLHFRQHSGLGAVTQKIILKEKKKGKKRKDKV